MKLTFYCSAPYILNSVGVPAYILMRFEPAMSLNDPIIKYLKARKLVDEEITISGDFRLPVFECKKLFEGILNFLIQTENTIELVNLANFLNRMVHEKHIDQSAMEDLINRFSRLSELKEDHQEQLRQAKALREQKEAEWQLERDKYKQDINNATTTFLDAHTKMFNEQKNVCFSGWFKRTQITRETGLATIIKHVMKGDNRSRKVFEMLNWLTPEGLVGEKCPPLVQKGIEYYLPKPKENLTPLQQEQAKAKEIFLQCHDQMLKQQKSVCLFGWFTRTKITSDLPIDRIIFHAMSGNNRSRKVLEELNWLTADGKVSKDCPACIQHSLMFYTGEDELTNSDEKTLS